MKILNTKESDVTLQALGQSVTIPAARPFAEGADDLINGEAEVDDELVQALAGNKAVQGYFESGRLVVAAGAAPKAPKAPK